MDKKELFYNMLDNGELIAEIVLENLIAYIGRNEFEKFLDSTFFKEVLAENKNLNDENELDSESI